MKGLKVLLVEDHDVTRAAVGQILRAAGAQVLEAPTVGHAMSHLDDGAADAMLLDMMLPDADGTVVLQRLLDRGRPEPLKAVLVLTGDVTPERMEEVHRLGADGLLHKPIDPQAVITFLKEKCQSKPEIRSSKSEIAAG